MSELQESLSKCKIDGNVLSLPPISDGMLPNYQEVRKALLNAGAVYKRNTFVFPNAAQPYIDKLLNGTKVNIKKEFQFFGTPKPLAQRLVKLAKPKQNHRLLEPEAGQAAIVDAIISVLPSVFVDVCEIFEVNINILGKHPNIHFICEDFLKIPKQYVGYYDRIIANPPFNKNQDIDHIRKMYECLKEDGGRIVSMASNHWRNSSNKKEAAFKQWLDDLGANIINVEAGEFKDSGTSVATCIVVIDK